MKKLTAKQEKLRKEMGIRSLEEIRNDIQKKIDDDYNATSLDKRKEFISYMCSGKNLGQARDLCGIGIDTAVQIILRNAPTIQYFPTVDDVK